MIITIDGPAGSGKSTAARELAKALGIAFLDTGATYRAVTLRGMRLGTDLEAGYELAKVAREMDLQLRSGESGTVVILDGEDVSAPVRTEEVSANSYYAARSRAVREVLVDLQRRLGGELGSFVSEGRDQGSVVFPDADVKFYLDARPEVRARRRYEQILADHHPADYQRVLESIAKRDARDRGRRWAPLIRPEGAIAIETSDLTLDQVVAELRRHVEAAR